VPSGFRHGGGGSSAAAIGASAIAAVAAPAQNIGVISLLNFAFMILGYHDRRGLNHKRF
jgi:hypothetical protein